MENQNKDIQSQTDAKECAELIDDLKKDARLYSYISVAMQSYINGVKTALNCKKFSQFVN